VAQNNKSVTHVVTRLGYHHRYSRRTRAWAGRPATSEGEFVTILGAMSRVGAPETGDEVPGR